jgi:hypothetical protein
MNKNGMIDTVEEYQDYILDEASDILKELDYDYENISFLNLHQVFEEVPRKIKERLENIVGYMEMLQEQKEE